MYNIGYRKPKHKSIPGSRLWNSSTQGRPVTCLYDRWPSQTLSFIYFKTNQCEHLDRSCNGGAADGESVKVETTTFEENSQTSIADNLFRWNITLKIMLYMCGGREVSRRGAQMTTEYHCCRSVDDRWLKGLRVKGKLWVSRGEHQIFILFESQTICPSLMSV